jgi:capsular exopolysaccharide synthesis family protein
MAERCRGIRTSLTFALPAGDAQILLVTSPATGEGKSSTSINLAISYCLAKKRVALVDADMRRPRVHQVFPAPVDRSEVGLSAVLRGQATLDEAIQARVADGPEELSVLTCGEIPSNPAELLDGAAWRRVLAELRERFDVVIIDSPPLLPVSDPLIAATQVDGVILVARCGATTRSVLQRAVGMLRQTDTNVLGIVLNQVDPRAESRGYGYGYGYGYKSAYYTYGGPRQESAEQA